MLVPLANYEAERQAFQALLQTPGRQRVFMVHGPAGSGKTHFLDHCLQDTPADVPYVSLQLRGRDTTIAYVLSRIARRYEWDSLPLFARQISQFLNGAGPLDNAGWRLGLQEHLLDALSVADVADRAQRRGRITDAFLLDLQSLNSPLLLVFDTYEQATSELDDWFVQQFLPWSAELDHLRVLVAGRRVPEPAAAWRPVCSVHELRGVVDAEAWLPVAQAMGREVPSLEYLAGVCAALQGSPADILKFLDALPRGGAVVAPQESLAARRAVWRKNFVESFEVIDLKELCFDHEIPYDQLGSDDNKRTKIIALMEYMDNRGRLDELLRIGRELRPHLMW